MHASFTTKGEKMGEQDAIFLSEEGVNLLTEDRSFINSKISLPPRMERISKLPWYECWLQKLRTEKKSEHTIRSYIVGVRTFSMTVLPNENQKKLA